MGHTLASAAAATLRWRAATRSRHPAHARRRHVPKLSSAARCSLARFSVLFAAYCRHCCHDLSCTVQGQLDQASDSAWWMRACELVHRE